MRPAKLDIQHNKSLEEIASELGVSRARVQTIIARALVKLRRECEKRGILRGDDIVVGREGESPSAQLENSHGEKFR